jgi:hypothetical protein
VKLRFVVVDFSYGTAFQFVSSVSGFRRSPNIYMLGNEDRTSVMSHTWTADTFMSYYSVANSAYSSASEQKTRCFPCLGCGRSYRWLKHLTAHQRRECGQEPRLQCPVCTMRTKRKENLKRHLLQVHPEYMQFL